MKHVVFFAAGIEVEARPEPQPGGAAPPGVAITLCTPSPSIASRELRLEPAVAKKLLAEILSPVMLKLTGGVTISRIKTGDEHTYVFRMPGATIYVRGLIVAEMLHAVERIVVP